MLHASRFARNRFVEGRAALQRTLRQGERLVRGVPAKPARSAGNAFRFAARTVTRYRTSPKFVSRGGVTRYEHRVVKLQYPGFEHTQIFEAGLFNECDQGCEVELELVDIRVGVRCADLRGFKESRCKQRSIQTTQNVDRIMSTYAISLFQ